MTWLVPRKCSLPFFDIDFIFDTKFDVHIATNQPNKIRNFQYRQYVYGDSGTSHEIQAIASTTPATRRGRSLDPQAKEQPAVLLCLDVFEMERVRGQS